MLYLSYVYVYVTEYISWYLGKIKHGRILSKPILCKTKIKTRNMNHHLKKKNENEALVPAVKLVPTN